MFVLECENLVLSNVLIKLTIHLITFIFWVYRNCQSCINSTVVVFQFLCPVEDTKQVYDQLSQKFPKASISSELEYVPHTLVSLSNELLQQAEKLIETLEDHIDVVRIYDNIQDYPSATCKLFGST